MSFPKIKLPKLPPNNIKVKILISDKRPDQQTSLGYRDFENQKMARVWGDIWEAYKLVANPWWLVNPTPQEIQQFYKVTRLEIKPLIQKKVISRAYHKMLEMLVDFNLLGSGPKRIAAMAEAPGGFVQAMVDYGKLTAPDDKIVGMSLKEPNTKGIPIWDETIAPVFSIDYGKGDGNLCDPENLQIYAKNFPKGADLATADGGFEVLNPWEKEARVTHLMWMELLGAIMVLKNGGHFVLKTYSLYTVPMLQLLYVASMLFDEVWLTKPVTSRITNTENYLVCKGFQRSQSIIDQVHLIGVKLREIDPSCSTDLKAPYITQILDVKIPPELVLNVKKYNQQMEAIREKIHLEGRMLITDTLHNTNKKKLLDRLTVLETNATDWHKKYPLLRSEN